MTDDIRCPIALGPSGDDSRRCERRKYPLHRTHLVEGVYYLPSNTDVLNRILEEEA